MKKPFRYLILAFVLTAMLIGYNYVFSMLEIITGYAAKNMCSCAFVADRDPELVSREDLNFSLIKYAKTWIDRDKKEAYSTIFGLARRKAIFREGLGCTLILDNNEADLRKESLDMKIEPPAGIDTIAWPAGERIIDTVFNNIDYPKLQLAIDNAFDHEGEVKVKRTRAVVVVYKNHLLAEKYAEGFDKNTRQLGWSMTKSITNAMIGILIREGKLDVNETPELQDWERDDRKNIRINDLMQMNSGLEWNEGYGSKSDATVMLYLVPDKSGYAIDKPGETESGTSWVYSSGTANILQAVIRNQFSDLNTYWTFPHRELFVKTGMYSVVMEPDGTGTYVGSSYSWATPRDWARFGLLYLNDGIWNDERILPEGWIDYTTMESPGSGGLYGAQVRLNKSEELPDVPKDMFYFRGFQDQRVFVIPSRSLVIVRLGVSEDKTFNFNELLGNILDSFDN